MTNTHCLTSGTLGTGELPVPNVSAALMSLLTVTPGSRRGVVVMIPGIQATIQDSVPTLADVGGIQPIKWLTLATALQSDGWIVIQPQNAANMSAGFPTTGIYNDFSNDSSGHGSRFKNQVLHWWDHIVAWVQTTYSSTFPIVPLGFSWGGLHVLQIAANRASTLTAYVTHHPVTTLSALSAAVTTPSDFTALNTTGFDATSTMLNAVAVPGLIGWGTSDAVVTYTDTQAIYNAANGAGKPVTSNSQASGHVVNATDVTTITGWFTSTVDPLAPANR